MARYALLVAAGKYADPTYSKLRAPAQDVRRMAEVLLDPERGRFDTVITSEDEPAGAVKEKIEDLVFNKTQEDIILLYFSCHGLTDPRNNFYLLMAETTSNRIDSTSVDNSFLHRVIQKSHARSRVLVLDCCYAAATRNDIKSVARPVPAEMGHGFVVLAASDRFEAALIDDVLIPTKDALPQSVFTKYFLQGISTGDADQKKRGAITVADIFGYTVERMRKDGHRQNPQIINLDGNLEIVIAYVPAAPPPSPPKLPVRRPPPRVLTVTEIAEKAHADLSRKVGLRLDDRRLPDGYRLPSFEGFKNGVEALGDVYRMMQRKDWSPHFIFVNSALSLNEWSALIGEIRRGASGWRDRRLVVLQRPAWDVGVINGSPEPALNYVNLRHPESVAVAEAKSLPSVPKDADGATAVKLASPSMSSYLSLRLVRPGLDQGRASLLRDEVRAGIRGQPQRLRAKYDDGERHDRENLSGYGERYYNVGTAISIYWMSRSWPKTISGGLRPTCMASDILMK